MTNSILTQIDRHIENNIDKSIALLERLTNQPSVSAQNLGIEACAELVRSILAEQGYSATIMPSDGNPVVYGEGEGASDKTLLFYLHYDVQPAEPLELWDSPPFEMTRKGDILYGRGISDDKAHIVARLAALEAIREVTGAFPCRVKFLIEGEEEIGSVSMPAFVETHQELLAADACVWEFGGINEDGNPLQYLGLRGMCYVELSVRTASRDAHSGLGGSLFENAAWRLVWALNTLKDQDERILIDGFYDQVIPPTEVDKALLAKTPDRSQDYLDRFDLSGFLKGETDLEALKLMEIFEPTCTICGLTSGYQGPGSKTVQPAVASAKVDFRLVPDQDPAEVLRLLRAHLDKHGFEDVEIRDLGGGRPARVAPDHPFVQLANETAREVYGKEMVVYPFSGGSGPNYPFIHVLGLPVVTAGVGYPETRAHAPNENVRISDLILGIKHTAHLAYRFGQA